MDFQSQDNSSKRQAKYNMVQETKDTIANITTVTATGSVVMGASEVLTLILLVTGIIFNVVRIYEIKNKKKDQ